MRELWEAVTGDGPVPESAIDAENRRVLDAIGSRNWLPSAEIARRAGLAPGRVTALLGILDLEGVVERGEAGWRKKRLSDRRG